MGGGAGEVCQRHAKLRRQTGEIKPAAGRIRGGPGFSKSCHCTVVAPDRSR